MVNEPYFKLKVVRCLYTNRVAKHLIFKLIFENLTLELKWDLVNV